MAERHTVLHGGGWGGMSLMNSVSVSCPTIYR